MSMGMGILLIAIKELVQHAPGAYKEAIEGTGAKEIEEIINTHALGAAAAGLGVAWIPGAGGTAALMAVAGFIWSMYYRINKKIGIPISKAAAKSLGSAVLSNLAANAMLLVGGTVLVTALSFTGIGNVFSSLIMAALDYAVVMVAGVIYLKLLTKLFKAGHDLGSMSDSDLKSAEEGVIRSENVNKMLKDAKKQYTFAYKKGTVSGKETVDLEEE